MAANLSATLDRFEQELAVLRFDDGQELVVAKGQLPPGTSEGAQVVISLRTSVEEEAARAEESRKLLSDILQGGA